MEAAWEHEIAPTALAALCLAESMGDPKAVSKSGAVGLCQIKPATSKFLGFRGNLKNPTLNIKVAAAYLETLEDDHDYRVLEERLMAYNLGPTGAKEFKGNKNPFEEKFVQRFRFALAHVSKHI
ncbi:lytic transglycosylase domain-containing protein [bacterium]|nr:lytic transglycosylase domain-containing protein [bacterium]